MSAEPQKWAFIAAHKLLPDARSQIAQSRAWGVADQWLGRTDVSARIIDDARGHRATTAWKKALPNRADWLHRMQILQPGSGIVFCASPLCVGWSSKQADETIRAIWSAGMSVYVHSDQLSLEPGADIGSFLETVARLTNAAAVAHHRSRKKVSPGRIGPLITSREGRAEIRLESGPIPRGYCIYRCFDASGTLLYVGCTAKWTGRRSHHARSSAWFTSVAKIDLTPYPSQRAALDAEAAAIWAEKPVHNRRRHPPRALSN